MAETVRVTLDRARAYRAKQEDTKAIWVGPGEVEVPAWVAEAWGLTPQPQAEPLSLVEVQEPPDADTLVLVEEEPAAEPAPEPQTRTAKQPARGRKKGQ